MGVRVDTVTDSSIPRLSDAQWRLLAMLSEHGYCWVNGREHQTARSLLWRGFVALAGADTIGRRDSYRITSAGVEALKAFVETRRAWGLVHVGFVRQWVNKRTEEGLCR